MSSRTVYTSINGFVDGEQLEYNPSIFSSVSEYFMTHIVSAIPKEVHKQEMIITATLVTKNGDEIDGDEKEIVLKEATDYTTIMGE